jgi:pimeloyl-ACP methyl ester carboxylesterase
MAPGPGVACGYLTVPEQHSQPAGPTIELGVVILKSTGASPRPDPLVMAQGGPGGSTIHTYTTLLLNSPLRRERDIVLFDQRGAAGY